MIRSFNRSEWLKIGDWTYIHKETGERIHFRNDYEPDMERPSKNDERFRRLLND